MKRILYAASLALAVLFIPACGGGGSNSSSGSKQTQGGGLAPDSLTSDMYLTPAGFDRGGRIWLEHDSVRSAHFCSERDDDGNYADSGWSKGAIAYTGNYTYTKCGPNKAELRLENLRAEPQDTADDCIWTIIGYLTFEDEEKVSFVGTQTLINSHTGTDDKADHNENHNDPLGFTVEHNHFPGVVHPEGGSRNFKSVYTYMMGN